MAATGFTPIKLYASSTASAVPLAANLDNTNGAELAINTADGRLFYKDSAGVVQTMASKATGAIGGSTTQVQFNNAGVLGGSASLTWSGTVLTSSGFSGPLNGTVGATTPAAGSFTTVGASGVATFSAGSAAAPAITTTGDTNTGIFFPAADTIAFSEGGTEAMRIDSSGNVGIGTNSPTKKLDVSSSTQRGQIAMSGSNVVAIRWASTDPNPSERNWEITNNVDAQGALSFRTGATQTADPTTTRMIIDSSGNLLVGTTSSSGTIATNVQPVVAGIFRSATATVNVNNNTAGTLFTLPDRTSNISTYIVSATINTPSASAANYSAYAIICVQNNTAKIMTQVNGANMTITLSGLNVQVTQTSGGNQDCIGTVTRVA